MAIGESAIRAALSALLRVLPEKRRRDILFRTFGYCARKLLRELESQRLTPEQQQQVLHQFADLLDTMNRNPQELTNSLKPLLELDNKLYRLISNCAHTYDSGLHPKHRMTGYHDFFCRNVGACESVLDIGCGNGFLTSDIAKSTTGRIVGIDKNAVSIEFANSHYKAENIEFICADISTDAQLGIFDVVVLSNVLEHLPERSLFLRKIQNIARPSKFLIRVPMYEREWLTPLKKELGIDYRLDATHATEYTQQQLIEELAAAGLTILHMEIKWGEFWLCAGRSRP